MGMEGGEFYGHLSGGEEQRKFCGSGVGQEGHKEGARGRRSGFF